VNSLSGAEPAPVLTVRNLRKTFTLHTIDGRTLTSLNGVSLDVAAGEHVAIAGPNGAGKSSLLRCIRRTYLPDSGSVVLHRPDGPVELTRLPDRAMTRLRGRDICYVSQFLEAPGAGAVGRGLRRAVRRRAAADQPGRRHRASAHAAAAR
jgi:alpha-D-ribose 1-methylphosphonate 5-triphosphate synthase subunit PhnL